MAFKRFLGSGLLSVAGLCFLLLLSSSANAATLNVSGGQLLGASGVIVDGSSYNVEFLDGTCIALYDGCDSAADFTFTSAAAASLASLALLSQVFLDGDGGLFDTDPELTAGCTSVTECIALTPFEFTGATVGVSLSRNQNTIASDFEAVSGTTQTTDTASIASFVFAVWSPVPEPGTAVLMGLGLLGLASRRQPLG